MRAHLHTFFTRAAEHHLAKAKHHRALSGHYSKLAEFHKAQMDGEDETHPAHVFAALADAHSDTADEHVTMAEHCASCAEVFGATGKAMGLSDFDRELLMPMPDGLSTIHDAPPAHLRAVPRHGQPEIPTAKVAEGFEHLVKVE